MHWKKPPIKKIYERYSASLRLRREGKINDEFIVMLNSLTIEDLIGLKLEASAKIFKGKMYGLNLLKKVHRIAAEAVVKFALSSCVTNEDAGNVVGVSQVSIHNWINKFDRAEKLQKEKEELDNEGHI